MFIHIPLRPGTAGQIKRYKMKEYYICKYSDHDEDTPFVMCNGTICSEQCRYTSDPKLAKYKEHEFTERNGDLFEKERA